MSTILQSFPRAAGAWALSLAVLGVTGVSVRAATQIPTTYVLPSSAGDTTKPGFIWNFHEVSSGQPNTLGFTEAQLAGQQGNNIGDPTAQGVALAPAAPANPATAPITFEISTVINVDKVGGSHGNFTPDDQMPGLQPTATFTDNTAAEVLTYLDLPAGTNTMGVNSDDGFRVTIGGAAPQDKFNAVNVGQFEGGRGAADTTFTFVVQQAGIYAARMIWENGGGDANVEWFTVAADGTTKILVNDTAGGGIKAYRAVTAAASKAYVSTALPLPGQTGVAPNAVVTASVVDGPTAIDPATVKLKLDGVVLTLTPVKTGNKTTITYTPSPIYTSGSSHNVSLLYNEGATTVTQNWAFSVQTYVSIPPTAAVTPDTTKPGFVWNIFQNDADQQNTNDKTDAALAGQLLDATTGTPLANLADPTAQGVALAPASPANPAFAPLHFEVAGVLNVSQTAGELNGNFTPDDQVPGIQPGTAPGIAAEAITYLELPAGLVGMGVNSDDGFRTTLGIGAIGSTLLGQFEGGRGAADTIFYFFVQQAGVYPFRTSWEQGGGGANFEWFSLKANGSKVLVNDVANGGLKAYRALSGPANPYVKYVAPSTAPRQLNKVSSAVTVVIADGTNPVDINSVSLKVDGQAVTTVKTRNGTTVSAVYTPTGLAVPTDVHNAQLTYKDTGTFTGNPQWQFRNLKNLVVPAPKITENFDSYPEDTQPPGWVFWNFTSVCNTPDARDITDQTSASYENWVLVSTNNAPSIDPGVLNVAPGQTFNGQPVDVISAGNILYAESDSRCNTDINGGSNHGQSQFIVSAPFNCSGFTNGVVLTFSSLYTQNQDSVGTVEYSVDGGVTWLPVVYFLDSPDIVLNADGSVNAVATFTAPNTDTSSWVTNGVLHGAGANGYGDALGATLTAALGDYVTPRVNDDQTEGARIEVFRLTQAKGKSDVRLRFGAMGTDSWWFAVDNLAFYDVAAPSTGGAQPVFNAPTVSGSTLTISWTGSGSLEETTALGGTWSTSANQSNPQNITVGGSGNKFYRVHQP